MEQIVSYGSAFIVLVVNAVDVFRDWLAAHGVSVALAIACIIGLFAWKILNEWSLDTEHRLKAIEDKLGVQHTPPLRKRSVWVHVLVWFVVAVYLLGKSLQAEGLLALGGIALSGIVLFLCALCAYGFIDQSARDHFRKKRERREFLDKVYSKETDH